MGTCFGYNAATFALTQQPLPRTNQPPPTQRQPPPLATFLFSPPPPLLSLLIVTPTYVIFDS